MKKLYRVKYTSNSNGAGIFAFEKLNKTLPTIRSVGYPHELAKSAIPAFLLAHAQSKLPSGTNVEISGSGTTFSISESGVQKNPRIVATTSTVNMPRYFIHEQKRFAPFGFDVMTGHALNGAKFVKNFDTRIKAVAYCKFLERNDKKALAGKKPTHNHLKKPLQNPLSGGSMPKDVTSKSFELAKIAAQKQANKHGFPFTAVSVLLGRKGMVYKALQGVYNKKDAWHNVTKTPAFGNYEGHENATLISVKYPDPRMHPKLWENTSDLSIRYSGPLGGLEKYQRTLKNPDGEAESSEFASVIASSLPQSKDLIALVKKHSKRADWNFAKMVEFIRKNYAKKAVALYYRNNAHDIAAYGTAKNLKRASEMFVQNVLDGDYE